jgi:hypothetical protein
LNVLVTPFALAILRARWAGSHCARFFAGLRQHFIAQQCNQFFPADRMCRLLRDQRAQTRDAMAARQPLHPDNHDRRRRFRSSLHAASTSLRETVPPGRSGAASGPRVS